MKGDWPALGGELTRHHLRDVSGKGASKGSGAGIGHLCLGGQGSHDWFDISHENMKKMKVGMDATPPWKSEPALVRHLPLVLTSLIFSELISFTHFIKAYSVTLPQTP